MLKFQIFLASFPCSLSIAMAIVSVSVEVRATVSDKNYSPNNKSQGHDTCDRIISVSVFEYVDVNFYYKQPLPVARDDMSNTTSF
jgi:hypothetical protein